MPNTYKSLEEYCLDIAERSLSRAPEPPRAVSNVGRAAVVILTVYSFLNQIYSYKMLILLFYTFCLKWLNIGYAVDKKGFQISYNLNGITKLRWYLSNKPYLFSNRVQIWRNQWLNRCESIDHFPLIHYIITPWNNEIIIIWYWYWMVWMKIKLGTLNVFLCIMWHINIYCTKYK